MNSSMINIICANYALMKNDKLKRYLLYLNACEIIQINPFERQDEEFVNKRIDKASEYYMNALIQSMSIKISLPKFKKPLFKEHGKSLGRKIYKESKKQFKKELKYIEEARTQVICAQIFFMYMDKAQFEQFLAGFIEVATKKRFIPDPNTISKKWMGKDLLCKIDINSSNFEL